MPLSLEQQTEVAKRAMAWAQAVNADSVRAKDIDRALLLAAENYDVAEYAARIAISDMARKILRAVSRAIATGEISSTWANGEGPEALSAIGLGKFDPKLLVQVTLRQAQNAGEYQYAQETEAVVYLEYVTMRDSRVRMSHRERDGTILPKNHVWWQTNTPPLDPMCRCRIESLTAEEYAQRVAAGTAGGGTVPDIPMVQKKNKLTGEVVTLPDGVAPGFGLNPLAADAIAQFRKMLEARVAAILNAPVEQL